MIDNSGRTPTVTNAQMTNAYIENNSVSFQEHDMERLPEDAHAIWKQARDTAVESMKKKKNGRFYKKANAKRHIEKWALGLEQAPAYALNQPLANKIDIIRWIKGMEIMLVTTDHFIKVGDQLLRTSAGNLNPVKNMTHSALSEINQEDKTGETYYQAVTAIENLVA